MNKKKVALNLFSGLISQIIILVLGFVIPRLILVNYGSDTNGLTSTITQIFSYLALLGSGIGQATQNALYPCISKDDKNQISIVISGARLYYKKVCLVYGLIVLILAFALPLVIKTDVSYFTICFYVVFEGLTAIISFYFTSVWSFFLKAVGDNYVDNIIILITKILGYGIKIALVCVGFNIVYIQVGYFVVSLIQLLLYRSYMNKKYSWIDYKAASKEFKLKDRNSYLINEIAVTIFSSTDMIVLSIFVATTMSSVYSIYNMVFVSIDALVSALYYSIKYLLGQSYQDDIAKYSRYHDAFNSFFLGVVVILCTTSYWLIIPFINLYTSGVNDANYVYKWLPLLFCLIQIFSWSRMVPGNLTGLAGYAKKVSYISVVEAVLNISGSLIMVKILGIYGVLIATVIALPVKIIYVNLLSDKVIMKRSIINTVKIFSVNYVLFGIGVILCHLINLDINSILAWILWAAVILIIDSIVVFTINTLINKDLSVIVKTIKNKLVPSKKHTENY